MKGVSNIARWIMAQEVSNYPTYPGKDMSLGGYVEACYPAGNALYIGQVVETYPSASHMQVTPIGVQADGDTQLGVVIGSTTRGILMTGQESVGLLVKPSGVGNDLVYVALMGSVVYAMATGAITNGDFLTVNNGQVTLAVAPTSSEIIGIALQDKVSSAVLMLLERH